MRIYTIIAGVNGAGKSSLTGALKVERTDLGLIIDVDKISAEIGSAVAGGKEALKRINDALEKSISFTQETTLSGYRTKKTIEKAKEKDYTVRLYYVGLDTVGESLKRIDNRVAKGGHNIPKADVIRRFGTRFDDLIKILPYCNEAVFFDNDNGFVEVAEYKNGEFISKGDSPQWLVELYEALDRRYWGEIINM